MEQAVCISCSPVKTLKSSEQSSLESFLPARTFVLDISRAGIASVSYGLLLVLPAGIVALRELYCARKGRIGRKDLFSCLLFMTFFCSPRRMRCWQIWRLQSRRLFRLRQFRRCLPGKTWWDSQLLVRARRSPMASPWWKGWPGINVWCRRWYSCQHANWLSR